MNLVHENLWTFIQLYPLSLWQFKPKIYNNLKSISEFLSSRKGTGAPFAHHLASSNFSLTNGDVFGAWNHLSFLYCYARSVCDNLSQKYIANLNSNLGFLRQKNAIRAPFARLLALSKYPLLNDGADDSSTKFLLYFSTVFHEYNIPVYNGPVVFWAFYAEIELLEHRSHDF